MILHGNINRSQCKKPRHVPLHDTTPPKNPHNSSCFTRPRGSHKKRSHKRNKCHQNVYGLKKNAPFYKQLEQIKIILLILFYPDRNICISYNEISATLTLPYRKIAIYLMEHLAKMGYVEIRHKYYKNPKLHGRNYYVLTKAGKKLLKAIIKEAWTGRKVEFGRLPITMNTYACFDKVAWNKYQSRKKTTRKSGQKSFMHHKVYPNKLWKTCQGFLANFSFEKWGKILQDWVWSKKDFDSGALKGLNPNPDLSDQNAQGYDYSRLERMLDEAEANEREKLKAKLPPAFLEVMDRHGFDRYIRWGGLKRSDSLKRIDVVKKLLGYWEADQPRFEKIVLENRVKLENGFKMRDFFAFTLYRLEGEFGEYRYFTMRAKEMRKAISGEKTRLDDGVDTKYIVDSIRDKELKFGVEMKHYLLDKCLRKSADFVRTALDAVDFRLKLDGIKQNDSNHKIIDNPFGLLAYILKMPSVAAIRSKFWGRKCLN
jgi:predicted transcriptional regulator